MKLEGTFSVDPFKNIIEHRPWGEYSLYSDNAPCTVKILYIKKDEMLSMQYHFMRDQFYLLLDDDFIIEYSSSEVPDTTLYEINDSKRIEGFDIFLSNNIIQTNGKNGDMFGFRRKIVHRAHYMGNKECGRILDIAFGVNDENDIVRIRDKYGRV